MWTGVHRAQSVQVAVKFLTVKKAAAAFRAVFMREIEILAALDHPNVVRIWDHGVVSQGASERLGGKVQAGAPYLVMEQGRATLGDRKAVLPWSGLRQVAADLLSALAHAHAHGLLHRDMKPGNVLLCPAERPGERHRVVLTDFGFGGPSGEETQVIGLTPAYAAPEQLRFSARDEGPWTDLFGLGGVLWELLTGRPPYQADTVDQALALQARPLPRLEGVPPAVEGWIRDLLALSPTARPRSAAEALHALACAEGDAAGTLDVPASWHRPAGRRSGPRNLSGAGLGLVGIRSGSVARESERDALWVRLGAAGAGRASAVVLRGVEGIGKTHLARWLAATAHERCGATELEVAEDGLVAALRRRIGLQDLDARAARQRIGAWLAATGGAGWFEARSVQGLLDPGPATPDRFGKLADLLRRVAGRGPLVVRIEDADRLPEAVPFVSFVLSERRDLPVLFVLTAREGCRVPAAVELRLGPLTSAECDRLLREHLGLAPALRGAVAAACAGIPGVAQRLLRRFATDGSLAVDADGRWHRPGGAWAGLRDDELATATERIEAFLERRSETDRHATELAAAGGAEVRRAEYAASLRQAGVSAPGLPDALVEAGLWVPIEGGWRFTDGRIAVAVGRDADRSGRGQRWNEVLAAVLSRVPGPAAQVRRARHLVRAGRIADALGPWARGLAAHLAEQPPATSAAALEELARATASLELPPEDPRTHAAEELEAVLWCLAGEVGPARRRADALAARTGDTRSVGLRVRAVLHAEALELDEALAEAAAAVEAANGAEARALALLVLAEAELLAGRTERGLRRLDEALGAGGGLGSVEGPVLLARARWSAETARSDVARVSEVVERTGREALGWRLIEVIGRLALARSDAASAVTHLASARASFEGAGHLEAAIRIDVPLGTAWLARGDTGSAAACFGRASGSSSAAVRAAALAGRIAVAAASGDEARALRSQLEAMPGVARATLPDVLALL